MKIRGLKKVCGMTKELKDSNNIVSILYDIKNNCVYGVEYDDIWDLERFLEGTYLSNLQGKILYCGFTKKYMSMTGIKEKVIREIKKWNLGIDTNS